MDSVSMCVSLAVRPLTVGRKKTLCGFITWSQSSLNRKPQHNCAHAIKRQLQNLPL